MAEHPKQPNEGRRYKSFEEFTNHFYSADQLEKQDTDEQNASFGLRLSRELVRENVKSPLKKGS